jgi:cytochrome c
MRPFVLVAVLGLLLLQIAPVPYDLSHPPAPPELSVTADPDVPAPILQILIRSCMDCHSHETRMPWYGHVAPASWLLARDVVEARKAMNLSEWRRRPPAVRLALAAAACEDVKSGTMPKLQYLLLHPGARLSPADIATICGWPDAALSVLTQKNRDSKESSTE